MTDISWLLDTPIAHRGYWGKDTDEGAFAAENSLTAYQRAIDHGYNIEIDVHLMRDDVFAVFHDGDLSRVCGVKGKVANLTADQLPNYHLSGTDDVIPTLQQVLELVDGKVGLLIEMKDFTNKNDCCAKLYNVLKDYKGKYAIQSFNVALANGALQWWRKNTVDIPVGILSTVPLNIMLPCWRKSIRPDFHAFDIKKLPTPYVTKQRKNGVKVLTWTVRTQSNYDKARNVADNIIFDTYRPEPGKQVEFSPITD